MCSLSLPSMASCSNNVRVSSVTIFFDKSISNSAAVCKHVKMGSTQRRPRRQRTFELHRELFEALRILRKQIAHVHFVVHELCLVRFERLVGGRVDETSHSDFGGPQLSRTIGRAFEFFGKRNKSKFDFLFFDPAIGLLFFSCSVPVWTFARVACRVPIAIVRCWLHIRK
jgi:hypothetical protein